MNEIEIDIMSFLRIPHACKDLVTSTHYNLNARYKYFKFLEQ